MDPASLVKIPVTVRFSYEDVFNRSPRSREIRRLLRELPVGPTLRRIAAYSVMLLRGRHPSDERLQVALAYVLGGRDNRETRRLVSRLRGEASVFVWPEQLASLAKYVLLHCSGSHWPADGNRRLFEALLAYNSQYTAEIKVAWARRDDYMHFLPLEVRASVLDDGNLSYILERYARFLEWSKTAKDNTTIRCRMDLEPIVQEALGMDYDDYAACTLAFMSHFSGPTVDPERISDFEPILDVEAFVAGVQHQELLRKWLDHNSVSIEEARNTLENSYPSTSIASMYKLAGTPLLRLSPNHMICLVLPFLSNIVGVGLFYKINDYLRKHFGDKGSAQLRGFFAEFLEQHVRQLLNDATTKSGALVFGEVFYGKSEKRSTDVIVVDGDTMLFIEISAKRFHVEKSVLQLEREQIERDLKAMVVNKALELQKCVQDFKLGCFSFPGVDVARIRNFVGIVVTNQGLTRVIGCNQVIHRELDGRLPHLDSFDFIDIDEVELLPRIFKGDLSLANLFYRKAHDPDFYWQSLTNFLYAREYDRLRIDNPSSLRGDGIFFHVAMEAAKRWNFRTST